MKKKKKSRDVINARLYDDKRETASSRSLLDELAE
jgi:hypothetical protein